MSLRPQVFEHSSYEESCRLIRETGEARIVGGYQRIIFTNGCFDILHPGHLQTIGHARSLAGPFGAVVVGINDDDSCRRLKGDDRPVMDHLARGLLLLSLRDVDHVVTFEEDTPLKLIEALRPDTIVKGGDYDSLNVIGKNISTVAIAKFDSRWSTSAIVRRIKGQ